MFGITFLSAILGAAAVSGAPTYACSTAKANISSTFPAGQTTLTPASGAPSFVGLGVGVQNYTCSATGTYTSVGAVAQVFDISCLIGEPVFSSLSNISYAKWESAPASVTPQQVISKIATRPRISSVPLGQHFFVNYNGTLSPEWNFAESQKTAAAFVIGAKDKTLAAANATTDIAWLQLHGVNGTLATEIYRLYTRGGQPPASCTPGSAEISVKYTSQYWLFGSAF